MYGVHEGGEHAEPRGERNKLVSGDVEENEMAEAGDFGWEDSVLVMVEVQGREVVQFEG